MHHKVQVLQVLPQPAVPSKILIWLLYFVLLISLIAAIVGLNRLREQQSSLNKSNIFLRLSVRKNSYKLNSINHEGINVNESNWSYSNYSQNKIVNLEEVVYYECFREANIKNVTWLPGSSEEITYSNEFGEYTVMNVKDGSTYPSVDHHTSRSYLLFYPFGPNAAIPRQRIATINNCTEIRDLGDKQCIFKIILLSSITEKEVPSPNNELVSQFSQLVNAIPGTYNYINEDNKTKELFLYRKNKYTIHLMNVGNPEYSTTTTNSCIIKFFEEYEFFWFSNEFQSKVNEYLQYCLLLYTYSLLEICKNYSLEWKDNFTFDMNNPRYKLINVRMPTTFVLYPPMYSPSFKNHKPYSHIEKWKRDEKDRSDNYMQGFINSWMDHSQFDLAHNKYTSSNGSIIKRDSFIELSESENQIKRKLSTNINLIRNVIMIYQQLKQLVRVSRDLVNRVYKDDYQKHIINFSKTRMEDENIFELKRRRFFIKEIFEPIQIEKSDWFLHMIVDKNIILKRSFLNIALSNSTTIANDVQNHNGSFEWMPQASRRYEPLLAKNLYVTRILGIQIVGEDEVLVYFLAAPISINSQRLLYRLKVIYPPLEYKNHEFAQCMTCPENLLSDSVLFTNKDSFKISTEGYKPQCIYSDVLMSHNMQYYILNCNGPQLPWTSVVSTDTNIVIRQLGGFERFRDYHQSIERPLVHRFMVELEDGSWVWASIYVPLVWKQNTENCNPKLRLLLRIAKHQDDQIITDKYDLSLSSHLAALGNYAVLYVDVRGSELHKLDFIGLGFHEREIMQLKDYIIAIKHVKKYFQCLDLNKGIGVFGEAYGGYMALNLIASQDAINNDNDGGHKLFECCAAIRPFTYWQNYIYPFSMKPKEGIVGELRRKAYETEYLLPLVRHLRGNNFTLIHKDPEHKKYREYMDSLLAMLANQGVNFRNHIHQEVQTCTSKLKLYEELRHYFKECFH